VLEKLLINRINHHVFAHDIMNKNQSGFTPQRSTTDAAMAVKEFVQQGLYNLSKSYFSQRSAVLPSNNASIQRTVTKGAPQAFCCGPGY